MECKIQDRVKHLNDEDPSRETARAFLGAVLSQLVPERTPAELLKHPPEGRPLQLALVSVSNKLFVRWCSQIAGIHPPEQDLRSDERRRAVTAVQKARDIFEKLYGEDSEAVRWAVYTTQLLIHAPRLRRFYEASLCRFDRAGAVLRLDEFYTRIDKGSQLKRFKRIQEDLGWSATPQAFYNIVKRNRDKTASVFEEEWMAFIHPVTLVPPPDKGGNYPWEKIPCRLQEVLAGFERRLAEMEGSRHLLMLSKFITSGQAREGLPPSA